MRKAGKLLAVALGACLCVGAAGALTGCGGLPEGFTGVSFVYEADMYANPAFYELVKAYNDGQGQIDQVKVDPKQISGVGTTRTTYEGYCEYNVAMTDENVFKDIAMDGLFVNLNDYVKDDGYDLSGIATGALNSARMTIGGANEKIKAGAGQDLYAMPFGSAPTVIYYNKQHFENQKINVVSCAEENLAAQYPKLAPHGYAEYLNEPFTGAQSSQNLAGETVYKVFNNRIPMNWEETRYVAKMFTKKYNDASPSQFGYVNEWWFALGWSVGGDAIGWDGEKYDFTLMDKTANYLAVQDVTVNGKQYRAGDIISYEDKKKESDIASMTELYKLPSQYDAQIEFLRCTVGTESEVEEGLNGYGLFPTDLEKIGNFTNGTVAMTGLTMEEFNRFNRSQKGRFDVAPEQQFRKYEGGSVYYDGEKTFQNEYLKVIGQKYDGEAKSETGAEYKGAVLTHDGTANGTKIVGSDKVMSAYTYLVIPKNSDAEKFDAAWKFIKWACGTDAQKILSKTNRYVPVRSAAADEFAALTGSYNYWALVNASKNGDIGDWAYFENGEWVNRWSGDYNDYVRKGERTITRFLTDNENRAKQDCANTNFVLLGR